MLVRFSFVVMVEMVVVCFLWLYSGELINVCRLLFLFRVVLIVLMFDLSVVSDLFFLVRLNMVVV